MTGIVPSSSPFLGSPGNVESIAAAQIATSASFLAQLGAAASQLVSPVITPVFPTGGDAPVLEVPEEPELGEISWTNPATPGDFSEELEGVEFPDFNGEAPVLTIGTPPEPEFGAIPDAPGVNIPAGPSALTITLPAAPPLLQLNIGAFSGLSLPTFDAEAPVLALVTPSVTNYVPGEQYTSELLSRLQTSLLERIRDGGTGLNAQVEQAIFDRAREREAKILEDALLDLDRMEAQGYALPPGAYFDGRLKLRTEYGKVESGLSRDIMVKQAELELANVQEALKIATTLESQLLDNAQKIEQRVFEAAKYATEAAVQIYNAQVQAFVARIEIYRSEAQVYGEQIRGELAKVEVYKAQIDAERAKAEVNNALLQQYKIQADVALANVEIYKAEVMAMQVAAEIEKTRIGVYGEQIRAYAAKANAYTAEVEGYKASVQAEVSKQDAYRSQVQAFAARVDAAGRASDSRVRVYEGKVEAFKAKWEGYRAAAQAEQARVQALASNNSSLADIFRSTTNARASYNDSLTKQWQVALDQAQRVSEIGISAAKANGDMFITTRSLIMDASKVGAQVAAQLGAAALNAVNWSNSFSLSGSNSFSVSQNTNDNTNTNL